MKKTRGLWSIPAAAIVSFFVLAIAGGSLRAGQPPATHPSAPQPTADAVIGVVVKSLDGEIREAFRKSNILAPPEGGLFVSATTPNGPAQRASISPMDVIVVKDRGKLLATPELFHAWCANLKIGNPTNLLRFRLTTDMAGRLIWQKQEVQVTPILRRQLEDDRLRASYLKIDGHWMKLPVLDLGRPSSWSGTHPKEDGWYFRSRDGSITWLSDRTRRPPGSTDITAEVVARKRSDQEAMLPKVAVGEFGKVTGCRVSQVLGEADMIVEIGLDDLGWTRTGVPDRFENVRIVGLSTQGVVDDRRYSFNPPIAVIGTWSYTAIAGAKRTIFLAVTVETVRKGLSDTELAQLKKHLARASNGE